MEINYKKTLLVAGFLVLCIVIGYFIYRLFFQPNNIPKNIEQQQGTNTGQLPETVNGAAGSEAAGQGGTLPATGAGTTEQPEQTAGQTTASAIANGGLTQTTALNQTNSLAPIVGPDGSRVYFYNRDDGKFYSVNGQGQAVSLSDRTFYDVSAVTWSSDKNKAIIEYPDGAKILYNFQTQKQSSLPKHWQDFNFSPQSDQIVAKSIGLDSNNRWLVVANDDGSQAKTIEAIGDNYNNVYSSWSPNNLSVALYTESIDFNRQILYFIGQNGENFKSTVIEGRGPEFQWTPDGNKLLYSVYSNDTALNPSLWIVDAAGEAIGSNRQPLNLQTWADKCSVVSDSAAYCAVPRNLPEGAGLFPELAAGSEDVIYKINLTNGSHSLVAIPDNAYNIKNLMVSANEKELYFTDNATGNIRKIRLK